MYWGYNVFLRGNLQSNSANDVNVYINAKRERIEFILSYGQNLIFIPSVVTSLTKSTHYALYNII